LVKNAPGPPSSLLETIYSKGVTVDKKDIDRVFLESLDDVLNDLLGKNVREAFYDHLERNYYMGKEDVPKRLGDFLLILERTFGKSGKTIERAIARRLCGKLNQDA
jgi:hypothetical protein